MHMPFIFGTVTHRPVGILRRWRGHTLSQRRNGGRILSHCKSLGTPRGLAIGFALLN